MDYRCLSPDERTALLTALNRHVGGAPLLMGRDTSFAGTADGLPADEETVSAVRSVPTHY